MASNGKRLTTGLGHAERDRVLIRGHDLTSELLGNTTFTDMFSLMIRGELPTADDRRMLDALLTILIEHGLVTPVLAARFTYGNAPEAIQGAVAAALLSAGSKHLGSSENCARMLQEALEASGDGDLDALAAELVAERFAARTPVPGIGHRVHPDGDPRADRLFEIAEETGNLGTGCDLLQRIAARASEEKSRKLPVNVTGAIGAIATDMGYPWQITRGFALIGRALGALAHIREEMDNPITDEMVEIALEAVDYAP